MGGFAEMAMWGLIWAMSAVVVGLGLTAAAATLLRRIRDASFGELDFEQGYNLLAPVVDQTAA